MTCCSDGCVRVLRQEDHVWVCMSHVAVMGVYVKRIMCDMLQ